MLGATLSGSTSKSLNPGQKSRQACSMPRSPWYRTHVCLICWRATCFAAATLSYVPQPWKQSGAPRSPRPGKRRVSGFPFAALRAVCSASNSDAVIPLSTWSGVSPNALESHAEETKRSSCFAALS
eukprot:3814968-Prymnesium_polylepis.2